jgi:hypothetical protein
MIPPGANAAWIGINVLLFPTALLDLVGFIVRAKVTFGQRLNSNPAHSLVSR